MGRRSCRRRCRSWPRWWGEAAATFIPGDVDGLSETLAGLLGDADRRAELAEAGIRAVRTLSWERTARATADVYRSLGLNV